ncbi:MAG: hypothetical protein ABR608_07145 [Pseudonocardiaceae bacterium]
MTRPVTFAAAAARRPTGRPGGESPPVKLSVFTGIMRAWWCSRIRGGELRMASPAQPRLLDQAGPWTEPNYLALPEDRHRIELRAAVLDPEEARS